MLVGYEILNRIVTDNFLTSTELDMIAEEIIEIVSKERIDDGQ